MHHRLYSVSYTSEPGDKSCNVHWRCIIIYVRFGIGSIIDRYREFKEFQYFIYLLKSSYTICLCVRNQFLANDTPQKFIFSRFDQFFIHSSTPFFLGGLSLHLNHLIASRMTNYDWQFGTLPFGLFGSNLDTMGLETYPRTYSGQFWHMSLFDDFRAVWVFSKSGCSQKIKVFSMKERSLRGFAIQFSVQGSLG